MMPQWPESAVRCVFCRGWELYEPGENYTAGEMMQVRRVRGFVYAHRGCFIRRMSAYGWDPAVVADDTFGMGIT